MPQVHHTGIPVKNRKEEFHSQSQGRNVDKTVSDINGKPTHQWDARRHTSLTTSGLAQNDHRIQERDDQAL
jgi:hypothetical protein